MNFTRKQRKNFKRLLTGTIVNRHSQYAASPWSSFALATLSEKQNVLHNPEFKALLQPMIRDYREGPYKYWRHKIETEADAITFGGFASSGDEYQVEVQAFWDDHTKATIRVFFAINDGSVTLTNGSPVIFSYCEDFIIGPDDRLVGK